MRQVVIIGLSALICFAFISRSSFAGELQFAVVSMERVFDEYYQTKTANDLLQARLDQAETKRRKLLTKVRALKAEVKTLNTEGYDSSLSSAEQEKKKRLAEKKYIEYRDTEEKLIEFDKTCQKEFGTQMRKTQQRLVKEIRETIKRYIKGKGIILVFDSSGKTMNSVETIVYFDHALDITDDIITMLNKNAPDSTVP